MRVVFNVSSQLYDFVADQIDLIACSSKVLMCAVACKTVNPRLWSGFLAWLM